MELTDEILVRRAKTRDLDAFRQLVERYRERVYGIARGMTGNHGDADDIAQETFIRAYRKLGDFEGQSGLYTWLYRIAVNLSLDLLRRRSRRAEIDLGAAPEQQLSRACGGIQDAGEGAAALELREAVARGIEALPERHRVVLVLHDLEGLPHDEIAAVLGCSAGTVRSRLHYARRRLQKKLRVFVE